MFKKHFPRLTRGEKHGSDTAASKSGTSNAILDTSQERQAAQSDQSTGPNANAFVPASNAPVTTVVPPVPSTASEDSEASAGGLLLIGEGRNIGLTLVSEPKKPQSAIVDIVFVHGLTGNAYSTWLYRSGKQEVYWPYELLPKVYPDARILTFGYDADITQFWSPASSNRVGNHAENLLGGLSRLRARTDTENRKIIFVVHSLGGLVAECALNLSKSSPEIDIPLIEEHTVGIAFLGTPHHGSDYAAWITLASSLTNWLKRSNKNIVAVLEPDSEVLAGIQKGFQGLLARRRDAGKKISITCFFEELAVTGVGEIVPKHSAILPAYPAYGIRANHMDMTKFGNSQSPGFETVEGEIFKWVKVLRSQGQDRQSDNLQEDFFQSLDFPGISNRQNSIDVAHLETLHWIWTRSNVKFKSWLCSEDSLFWIAGKAGSGKSTIMKRLADDEQLLHELQSLERLSGEFRDVVIAACFLDYKGNALAKSAEGMLRAILRQVVTARPALFHEIEADFKAMKKSRDGVRWTLHNLQNYLVKIVVGSQRTRFFFLVDALDEYQGEDADVADIFSSLASTNTKNLQFCISSRPHIDFLEKFESCGKLRMEFETEQDIRKYTNSIFQNYIERHGDIYRVLVDEIVINAQGLFIWVKLASSEILRAAKRGEDIHQLQKRLEGMPQNLDEFYQRILDQLDPDDRDEARAMLSITIHSPEPLTPIHLRYAVHFATGIYTEFNEYLAQIRILAVCGGLLEFGEIESSHAEYKEQSGQKVSCHQSALITYKLLLISSSFRNS